jgi:PAS domain S-box-containing protein
MSKVSSIGDELAALASSISQLSGATNTPPELESALSHLKARVESIREELANEEASLWRPNQFDSLVAGLHIGVLVYGPQGQLWMSNQAALELLAMSRLELFASERWDSLREDGSPFPDEEHPVFQARLSGQPVRNVVMGVYRKRTQDRIWLLVSAEPKLNPDGTVKRVLCTFSDISDLKHAEQAVRLSEERFRRLFLSAPTGIAVVSAATYKIVQANPAFCRLVGYSEAELQAMTVGELTYPEDYQAEAGLMTQALDELGSYFLEKRYVTKSGELRWVHLSSTILPDAEGNPEYALGIVEDITERKRAEEALRTLFDAAQRQTQELTLLDRVRSAIARELDLQAIFKKVVEAIAETFGYRHVSIYLVQDGVTRLQHQVGYYSVIPELKITEGVSGRVVRSGKPLLVKDVRQDADFIGAIEGIVSEICVPLFDYEQVIGILNIESTSGVELNEDDLRVLVAVSEEISVALSRAKLYTQVRESEAHIRELLAAAQRQAQELALLERVRTALAREIDLNKVVHTIGEAIAETFGYNLVVVYLREGDHLTLQHQTGYENPPSAIPLTRGIMGRVARTGEAVFAEYAQNDPDYVSAHDDVTSEICVPLFVGSQVAGVFNVESTPDMPLTEADYRLMIALSEHIGLAIGRAQLYTQVRESEARNRAMLNAMPDMLVRHDPQGNYLGLKPAANFKPLLPLEEMLGKNIRDVLPHDFVESVLPRIARVLASGEMEVYEYTLFQEGTEKHFESRMVKVGDDEVIAITRDITDAKQALQNQFERERIRLLTSFISDTSHDLRNPIANLLSSTYLLNKLTERLLADKIRLTDLLDGAVTPEIKQTLAGLDETVVKIDQRAEALDKNSHRLHKLVESMIAMVRLESDIHFEFEPHDLNHLVKEGAQKLLPQAQAKDITLHIEAHPQAVMATVDEAEFSRVIDALLSNAIDYTPPTGTITLKVYQTPERIVCEVQDSGIGIAREDLPRIFEPFFRVSKARPTDTGGAGLGLTIAKKIVEAHGGRIEVESRLNQGSTFRIVLPRPSATS